MFGDIHLKDWKQKSKLSSDSEFKECSLLPWRFSKAISCRTSYWEVKTVIGSSTVQPVISHTFEETPALVSLGFGSFSDCHWRRWWHPTPVLLPGKSHERRSLVGCSPWGHEESDTTERLHFHFSLSCIGKGNGNPLQCCCLENPRDGGAWWASVYGVAQSRIRLK